MSRFARGIGVTLERAGDQAAAAAVAPVFGSIGGGARRFDMQPSAEILLKTYLGERTGKRVFAGQTTR